MHTVIIDGGDLEYFRNIVEGATKGDYGVVESVEVTVHDTGQLQFAVGDYATGHFGRPNAPLAHPNDTDGVTTFGSEGSGNPYANVSDEDSPAEVLVQLQHVLDTAAGLMSKARQLLAETQHST